MTSFSLVALCSPLLVVLVWSVETVFRLRSVPHSVQKFVSCTIELVLGLLCAVLIDVFVPLHLPIYEAKF